MTKLKATNTAKRNQRQAFHDAEVASQSVPLGAQAATPKHVSLRFISSDGTSPDTAAPASDDSRKAIRSHVMKNHFRQKAVRAESSSTSARAVARIAPLSAMKGRFRLAGSVGRKRRTAAAVVESTTPADRAVMGENAAKLDEREPPGSRENASGVDAQSGLALADSIITNLVWGDSFPRPGAHGMDPFDVIPIPGDVEVDRLLQFYNAGFRANSTYINTYVLLARHHPDVLHAILCSIALCCALATDDAREEVVSYHKEKARQAITDMVEKARDALPASAVALIVTLATFENLLGLYEIARLQVEALARILNTRGRLNARCHSDFLQRGLVRVDLHTSTSLRLTPVFDYHPNFEPVPLPQAFEQDVIDAYPKTFPPFSCDATDLIDIFYQLRRISTVITPSWISRIDPASRSNLIYQTERALLALPDRWTAMGSLSAKQWTAEYETPADHAAVAIGVRTAAHLFLYAGVRAIPPGVPTIARLEQRLRAVLMRRESCMIWLWEPHVEVLLWALCIAAATSGAGRRPEMRAWYVFHVRIVARVLDVTDVQGLESRLKDVVWVEDFFRPVVEGIWSETLSRTEDGDEYLDETTRDLGPATHAP